MRKPLGFTVVVGVDAARLKLFEQSWPAWRQHHPDLLALNWIVVVDGHQGAPDQWRRRLDPLDLPLHRLVCWGWPQCDDPDGQIAILQPERIATALLRVPAACCGTTHWVLIDPSATAVPPRPGSKAKPWLDPSWFPRSGMPVIVGEDGAPSPLPTGVQDLQAWADRHDNTLLRRTAPLDAMGRYPIPEPWLLVIESGFGKHAAQLCDRLHAAPLHLYLWYLARRLELPIRLERFDRAGWVPPTQTPEISGESHATD
jgi:hypothetical protein